MDDHDIIGYAGEPDASANIDLSIPLPGAHTGRRLIEIEDIPEDAWSDEARNAGTDWATELGFTFELNEHVLENPDLYVDRYYREMKKASGYGALFGAQPQLATQDVNLLLNTLHSATRSDATQARLERGNLRDWRGELDLQSVQLPVPAQSLARSAAATPNAPLASVTQSGVSAVADVQRAVAEAFSSEFQASLSQVESGIVSLPSTKWGGAYTTVEVDLAEPPQPRLFIVQVFGISSFMGDYGLGRTVKTLTLGGGEEYSYRTRTWRATSETRSLATSIVDSFDESSSERFADTVMAETTDTATQEKSSNWHVESEAKGSIGIASASVSGGGGGQKASSTEEFARSVDESVAEHANEASSHRENSVTSSSESSEETEEETSIERSIKNINVSRTLNYVLRELNSAYHTKTHLKDIRIAFSNGRAGSWRETPLSGIANFIDELLEDRDTAKSVLGWILDYVGIAFDLHDTPHSVLERVDMDKCGQRIVSIKDAQPDDDCEWALPPRDLEFFYRFKRGDAKRNYAIGQEDQEFPVEGVLLRERRITLRTDSVVCEGLLGVNPLLDDYSEQLQQETIRGQKLSNDKEALALEIIASNDTDKAALYQQLFGSPEDEEEATA